MALNSMVAGSRSAASSSSHQDSGPDRDPAAPDGDGGAGPAAAPVRDNRRAYDDDDDEEPQQTSIVNEYLFSITTWFSNLDKRKAMTVLTLVFVNLINYMDRSTVAGMINSIKEDPNFDIHNDRYLGLLQTAFVICYMIFAPIFGYLGDRRDRSHIMLFGLTLWSLATLLGSFMRDFWWFMFFRAVVGIGEASYSTIAPAIISDLFRKDTRSKVLALFYFAIPTGTGLGYMVGAETASYAHDWRWGLRVTPVLGLVAILAILFIVEDPPRGQSEGSHLRATSPREDVAALAHNKSYVYTTLAFTCVTFAAGALMWWGPEFAFLGAKAACGNRADCSEITQASVSYRFGIVMGLSGLIGVPTGSYLSQIIRHHVPNADPIVSGAAVLAGVPILYVGLIVARYSLNWCYFLTFVDGLVLNGIFAIVMDLTLYIVVPTRRSLASAAQILCSHALGDAISPYLMGVIADWVRPVISPQDGLIHATTAGDAASLQLKHDSPIMDDSLDKGFTPEFYDIEFRCLQYSLFVCCFLQAVGALFFFLVSFHVIDDKRRAERAVAQAPEPGTGDDDDYEAPIIHNIAENEDEEGRDEE